jgi:hypothetical protein
MLTNAHTTTSKAKTNASSNKNQSNDNSAGGNTSNKTYQLSGNGPALAAEVGHVVEIVAVEEQPPSGGKAPTRAAGTPVMVVEDVKLLSPNCQ